MPQEAKVFRVQIFRDLPVTILAQVQSLATGQLLVAADVASITYNVYDLEAEDPNAAIASSSVTVATALHALKLDNRWSIDTDGFNFDHTVPAGVFTVAGRSYSLQYLFTGIADAAPSATLVYNVLVLNTRG